ALADFSADGKRYLLTRHVLSDKTALGTGKTVVVNAVYWDFNGSHASVCKYSASASAAPTETITLVGTPAGMSEEELADLAAAKNAEDAINAIPDTLTEENISAVREARAVYDALTDAQKALVSSNSYQKLTAAEETVKALNYKIAPISDWEADLTDLSYWENAASNSLPYEFQRKSGYEGKIDVSFRMIWDYETLYLLVRTNDGTVHEADQIEFAYHNGTEASYFNTSFGGWQSSAGGAMISSQVATFADEGGNRYILTKHVLTDNSVLVTGGTVVINVQYRDFTEDTVQLCIYSVSASASPTVNMKLTGTPDVITEDEQRELEEVAAVQQMLISIPVSVTLEDESFLLEVKSAYDALNENQKARISSRLTSNLDEAFRQLETLKAPKEADEAAAADVIARIDSIGTVTPDKESAIVSARSAYDALSEGQKALVPTEKVNLLLEAEQILADLKSDTESEESKSEDSGNAGNTGEPIEGCVLSLSGLLPVSLLLLFSGIALILKKRRREANN
ncbi:MAG: hypothetical protein SOT34_08255, partial [Candidatus Borkfalkiaceae bacterium]|nr:hypothetical protein [Christensenellaceae bacterium]